MCLSTGVFVFLAYELVKVFFHHSNIVFLWFNMLVCDSCVDSVVHGFHLFKF